MHRMGRLRVLQFRFWGVGTSLGLSCLNEFWDLDQQVSPAMAPKRVPSSTPPTWVPYPQDGKAGPLASY